MRKLPISFGGFFTSMTKSSIWGDKKWDNKHEIYSK
jgi:hypothetical protein